MSRCLPRLYWFNPLCDLVAGRGHPFTPPAGLLDLAHDLAMVPALLAADEDVVVVPAHPSRRFLRCWAEAGLPAPELVAWDPGHPSVLPPGSAASAPHRSNPGTPLPGGVSGAPSCMSADPSTGLPALPGELAGRRLAGLRPWGWAPDSVAALQSLGSCLPAGETLPAALWTPARRALYSKAWSTRWLDDIADRLRAEEGDWLGGREVVGTVCACAGAVGEALDDLFARGWKQAVMKTAFGAAGGQLMRVEAAGWKGALGRSGAEASAPESAGVSAAGTGAGLLDYQRGWLRGQLRDAGAVVVEPWLPRILDFSAQYEVEEGAIRFLGLTRFLADTRGRFQGVFVHAMAAGLEGEGRRFFCGDDPGHRRLRRFYGRLGELLRARLPEGFHGPLGVDAFIYRAASGRLRLKPVVEVNPRYTMGRVALALRGRVLTTRPAVWRIVRLRDVVAGGRYAHAGAWAASLQARTPLRMTGDGKRIASGVLFTNEVEQARAFAGVLMVGKAVGRGGADP